MPPPTERLPRTLWAAAAGFAIVCGSSSWWRWWTFQYETFDLAFYVQGLWLALRGEWQVSLLNVPLLGNHAEPIVFVIAPLFMLWPHPMLLVGVQILALATMPFTAWRIARHLGAEHQVAIWLALTTLLMPASGFVAIHEFHPEAFAAPLMLAMLRARLERSYLRFCVWFLAAVACKENVALALIVFCAVHLVLERRIGVAWNARWNLAPGLITATWLALYAGVLAPRLNAGNVDYLGLYSHLGATPREIIVGLFAAPQRVVGAVWKAALGGDLVLGMLLPLAALPLFRLRWMVIAAPLLLQHLLSWRASEWSIRFHYAAPLIPIFWIATVEVLARWRHAKFAAPAVLGLCVAGQLWLGPLRQIAAETAEASESLQERRWKADLINRIEPSASVTAGLPYLSHLATRHELRSLHHILKGLKTLSRDSIEPARITDVVFVDFADGATFNAGAGYYHPQMQTVDGRIIPSSDRLLHEFLRARHWSSLSLNSLTLFTQASERPVDGDLALAGTETELVSHDADLRDLRRARIRLVWRFPEERQEFPWIVLVVETDKELLTRVKGPPLIASAAHGEEVWRVDLGPDLSLEQVRRVRLILYDNVRASWQNAVPPADLRFMLKHVQLWPAPK